MNRKILIINRNEDCAQNVRSIVDTLTAARVAPEIVVLTPTGSWDYGVSDSGCACAGAAIPRECDTEPKIRNWITRTHSGFDGFLHVITDSVQLLKDPSAFMLDLENMMTGLDYPVWLNTVCDGCNYVYQKYNPRVRIQCDRPECEKIGVRGELCFTSHSNTQWMCYHMPSLRGSDLLRFDERFTVPMFFIIEFLARRRNTKQAGSAFFMNHYLTVGSEYGTFRNFSGHTDDKLDQNVMQNEDAAFKAMNVNFAPDNNVDVVLETLWDKILMKSGERV